MNSIHTSSRLKHPKKSKTGSSNPNWRGGKIKKLCQTCGSVFEVIPSRSAAKYCSLPCCNKSPERRSLVRKPRAERVIQSCLHCGKGFIILLGLVDRKKFCCLECQFSWRKNRMSGENNPSWKGGTSQGDYPYNWPQISERIKVRDGHQCWNPACLEKDDRIVVHHIDFNKMNVLDENLITVCGSCNSRANYHRVFWKGFLSSFNKWRFRTGLLLPIHTGSIELNLGVSKKGE